MTHGACRMGKRKGRACLVRDDYEEEVRACSPHCSSQDPRPAGHTSCPFPSCHLALLYNSCHPYIFWVQDSPPSSLSCQIINLGENKLFCHFLLIYYTGIFHIEAKNEQIQSKGLQGSRAEGC